jgi:hypothetical protein
VTHVWVWEPDGPDGHGFYATLAGGTTPAPDGTLLVKAVTAGTGSRHRIGELVRVPARCVVRYKG